MIETERLVLRQWQDDDRDAFAAMSRDPEVMAHLDGPVDRDASDAIVDRLSSEIARDGQGLWAVADRNDGRLIGFCGIRTGGHGGTKLVAVPEIGWRLRRDCWNLGLAREAAEASLAWYWAQRREDMVYSWTVAANRASWTLMERLGMKRSAALDFDHPRFVQGHPLCRHIVYSIARPR